MGMDGTDEHGCPLTRSVLYVVAVLPPSSPLVGEGGRGDEGQKRTGMQNIAPLSQELYP